MDAKARERRNLLEQKLKQYVPLLREKANAEKVVVFGSLATGHIHEWSDIDLVVVGQTSLTFLDRLCKTQSLLQPWVGTYYTPEEFTQLCLVYWGQTSPRTRSMADLLSLLPASWKSSLPQRLIELDLLYTSTRYPDVFPGVFPTGLPDQKRA